MMLLMTNHIPPVITSFVIRFTMNLSENMDSDRLFRGSIRHVQSEKELNFRDWQEAVNFINGYVPIDKNDNS
jgi:hypothetical protein